MTSQFPGFSHNAGSGGDPHVAPMRGPAYTLPRDWRRVLLFADAAQGVAVEATCAPLDEAQLPERLWSRDRLRPSSELHFLRGATYYRRFNFRAGEEVVEVDARSLDASSSSGSRRRVLVEPMPSQGLYSLTHRCRYPASDACRGLRVTLLDADAAPLLDFFLEADVNSDEQSYVALQLHYDGSGARGALLANDDANRLDACDSPRSG